MAILKVTAVGDSNTANAGWPEQLQTSLSAAFPATTITVTKQALGGISTHEMLNTYIPQAIAGNPNVIAIMAGTNDPYYEEAGTGVPGVDYSIAGFEARMRSIIAQVAAASNGSGQYQGRVLLMLMTCPPAATATDGWPYARNRVKLEATARVMCQLAAEYNLPLVDVYNKIEGNRDWKNGALPSLVMTTDGVHFNTYGYSYMAEAVQETLRQYQESDGTLIATPKENGTRILFIGDSITWGDYSGGRPNWAETLIEVVRASYPNSYMDVKNFGVGGACGRDLAGVAQRKIYDLRPNIVSIMYGFNDAYTEVNTTHVDGVPAFETAYRSVLTYLQSFNNGTIQNGGRVRVVLMTPPQCVGSPYGVNNTILARYADKVRALAAEFNTDLVDIFAMNMGSTPSYYNGDGIHPNVSGSQQIYNAVQAMLGSMLTADGVLPGTPPDPPPPPTPPGGWKIYHQGAFINYSGIPQVYRNGRWVDCPSRPWYRTASGWTPA
jgi:lysophospholipase L1-like esterase